MRDEKDQVDGDDLPHVIAPGHLLLAFDDTTVRQREGWAARVLLERCFVNERGERRIEDVENHSAAVRQRAVNRGEARELFLDRDQVLEGAKRQRDELELRVAAEVPHVARLKRRAAAHVRRFGGQSLPAALQHR